MIAFDAGLCYWCIAQTCTLVGMVTVTAFLQGQPRRGDQAAVVTHSRGQGQSESEEMISLHWSTCHTTVHNVLILVCSKLHHKPHCWLHSLVSSNLKCGFWGCSQQSTFEQSSLCTVYMGRKSVGSQWNLLAYGTKPIWTQGSHCFYSITLIIPSATMFMPNKMQ